MSLDIARYGFTAVYTAPNAAVDIIFLHGLGGHPASTWRANATSKLGTEGGTFWPAELLPKSLRDAAANILVYGYNADLAPATGLASRAISHGYSQGYLQHHAQSLLSALASYRQHPGASGEGAERPILWVVHSLGGIVLKAALNFSSSINDDNLEDQRGIYVSTYGILFLGTPHGSFDSDTWRNIIQRVADAVSYKKPFPPDSPLLSTLKEQSETFATANSQFLGIQQRFKICIANEAQKTDVKGAKILVVDPPGASNQLPGAVYFEIEARHSELCKFRSRNAPGYANTASCLLQWADDALGSTRLRWQMEREGRQQRLRQHAIGNAFEPRDILRPSFEDNLRISAYNKQQMEFLYRPEETKKPPEALFYNSILGNSVMSGGSSRPNAVPTPSPPEWRSVRPNSHFVGRQMELIRIHELLMYDKRRTPGTSSVLVTGVSGSGKTHLARQYVFNAKEQYPGGVYWVRSNTIHDMESAFWQIANSRDIKEIASRREAQDSSVLDVVKAVRDWFNSFDGWLLVFDGISFHEPNAVKKFFPDRKNTSVLFTSTQRIVHYTNVYESSVKLELDAFPEEVARSLLMKESGQFPSYSASGVRAAQQLVRLVKCLPLIVHAAARYLNATGEQLATYATALQDFSDASVKAPFSVAWKKLSVGSSVQPLNLMCVLCFFDQHISFDLLSRGVLSLDKRTPEKGVALRREEDLEEALNTLISFALIERIEMKDLSDTSSSKRPSWPSQRFADMSKYIHPPDSLHVHTVTQEFVIEKLIGEQKLSLWLERAISVFCDSYDQFISKTQRSSDIRLLDDCRQYLKHGVRLKDLIRLHRTSDQSHNLTVAAERLAAMLGDILKKLRGLERDMRALIFPEEVDSDYSPKILPRYPAQLSVPGPYSASGTFYSHEPDESSSKAKPEPRGPSQLPKEISTALETAIAKLPGGRLLGPLLRSDAVASTTDSILSSDNQPSDGSNARQGPQAAFKEAVANSDIHELEQILRLWFDDIAKDEFQWLLDARDLGMEPKDMADMLLKSSDVSTWESVPLDLEERLKIAEQMEEIPIDFHQTPCAHRLDTTIPSRNLSFGKLAFDERHFSCAEDAAWLCGLAGALPPLPRDKPSPATSVGADEMQWASAVFQESTARVIYGSGPFADGDTFPTLLKIMRRVQMAMMELQQNRVCCDRLTVLAVPCHVPPRGGLNIALKVVLFACVNELTSLLEGEIAPRRGKGKPPSSDEQSMAFGYCCNLLADIFDYPLDILYERKPSSVIMVTVQFIALSLVLYCRSYVGEFHPPFAKGPLSKVTLLGGGDPSQPYLVAQPYRLACMAPMLQDTVFAFSFHEEQGNVDPQPPEGSEYHIVGNCESIVDVWGPASIIAGAEGCATGESIYGLRIGGGVIARSKENASAFHWSSDLNYHLSNSGDQESRGFTYWQRIKVGAPPTINGACSLDEEASYKMSAPWLTTCGTEPSKWINDERQLLLQGGQFVQMSVGNVYHKVPKKTLKAFLLDTWAAIQDVHVFNYFFGVQVSLCTGVARRVPLRALIEEPLLSFVDTLRIEGWQAIKTDARRAFAGDIDFDTWLGALSDDEHKCVRQVCGKLLELLKNTGFDRDEGMMRVMWPSKTNPYLCVTAVPEKAQVWWRILRDSEWCATFAVATSQCLETTEVRCRHKDVIPWHGGGTLFSTAMYPSLKNVVAAASVVTTSVPPATGRGVNPAVGSTPAWALEDGSTYWIGQQGADTWVLVRKPAARRGSTKLYVRQNVFPGPVARWMLRDRVLRERSDLTFLAEEVLVQQSVRAEKRGRGH